MESTQGISDLFNVTPLLICPYCKKNIPQITLQGSKEQMSVYLKCSCLNQESYQNLEELMKIMIQPNIVTRNCISHFQKAKKYCPKCSLWLCSTCLIFHCKLAQKHSLIDYELNIHCQQHENVYSFYCEQCNTNLCLNCKINHQTHKIIKILGVEFPLNELNNIDSIIANNRHITDVLVQKIGTEINKLLSIKEDIQLTFNINNSINQNLRKLYHLLCSTSLIFNNYPLYQIMKLKQTIKINNKQLEEGINIEDSYKKFKNYLKNNNVLIQNTTNECKTTLIGHTSYVSCLCQLKDSRLVSGSSDKSIKFWNPKTFQCMTTLFGHDDYVCCLCELNTELLASGASDKSIKLWNLKSFECFYTLIGHNDYVNSLIRLQDDILVSCSDDMTIKMWNINNKNCLLTLKGHTNSVLCLLWLNNERVASGSKDKTIKLWNIKKYSCLNTLIGHTNIVLCVILLIDGRLASGSLDKSIKIWDTFNLKCVATLIGHYNYVSCLIQLYDGRLASGSWDKTIKSWNTTTNRCKATLTGHNNNISCLIQLSDGRLVSGCDDETIKFWST